MASLAMATTMNNNGSSKSQQLDDELLLAAARPFLRGELEKVEPSLPSLLSVLRGAGAGECYHKHGTFLAHLVDVYRILRLWGAPEPVARCGLFHSAYSNSYVDLCIFHPDAGRDRVRAIVGAPAERLVHLFCVVPRQKLIHDDLQFHYTDQELRDHLAQSQSSSSAAAWRAKLRSLVPPEGVVTEHIRTGEPVKLSRKVLAVFILMTVADYSDQYTDYQDKLFSNQDGRLRFRGDRWQALWPGTGKPGLWVSGMSRLAAIYNLIARDEQLLAATGEEKDDDDEGLQLVIPPVFERCSRVLDPEDQKAARDLYWEAICSDDNDDNDNNDNNNNKDTYVEALLRESIAKNPFVGEPHLVLAQVLLNGGRHEEAVAAADRGLRLLLEWGCTWDKRMSWEGWVSWGRVMRDKARHRQWPRSSWGIINLGLVDGVVNHTNSNSAA